MHAVRHGSESHKWLWPEWKCATWILKWVFSFRPPTGAHETSTICAVCHRCYHRRGVVVYAHLLEHQRDEEMKNQKVKRRVAAYVFPFINFINKRMAADGQSKWASACTQWGRKQVLRQHDVASALERHEKSRVDRLIQDARFSGYFTMKSIGIQYIGVLGVDCGAVYGHASWH